MSARLVTALLLILATPAVAQTVVDGTDAGIDRSLIVEMMREITAYEPNPGAAEFQRLVQTDIRSIQTAGGPIEASFICGFVSLGSRKTETLGPIAFFYNTVNGLALLYSEDYYDVPDFQALLDRRFEESGCRAALAADEVGQKPAQAKAST